MGGDHGFQLILVTYLGFFGEVEGREIGTVEVVDVEGCYIGCVEDDASGQALDEVDGDLVELILASTWPLADL